jgi:hypothetical protein
MLGLLTMPEAAEDTVIQEARFQVENGTINARSLDVLIKHLTAKRQREVFETEADFQESHIKALREINHELRRDREREFTARTYAENERAAQQAETNRAAREFEQIKARSEEITGLLSANGEMVQAAILYMAHQNFSGTDLEGCGFCVACEAPYDSPIRKDAKLQTLAVADGDEMLEVDVGRHAEDCDYVAALMGLVHVGQFVRMWSPERA